MDAALETLRARVQTNCHIADARHAGDYSLCIYLLKMREFFRWEQGYPFSANLPGDQVGRWLTEREQLWDTLEEQPFEPLRVDGRDFDPFDDESINSALDAHGLVYSGGLGEKGRPHFFLGRLERRDERDGFNVMVSGEEYARDITAPPAMARGDTVFVRRESLRRMIWEKVEEWRWNRIENAMSRAMAHYPFDSDVDAALEAMTDNEIDNALLHEIGEVRAGRQLGPEWESMLAELPRSQAEIIARAVRDHLADCLVTLPTLLDGPNAASLHFYFAHLDGMRRELFPSLNRAYREWVDGGPITAIQTQAERGARHWLETAQAMLAVYRGDGAQATGSIEALLDASRL